MPGDKKSLEEIRKDFKLLRLKHLVYSEPFRKTPKDLLFKYFEEDFFKILEKEYGKTSRNTTQ